MNNGKKSIIVFGTSGWAKKHVLAIKDVPELELVGVIGHSNKEALENFKKEFNVPVSLNADELLAEVKPDIIDVACNPHFRLGAVELAVKYGVKTVNLEKPLALTGSDATTIIELCQANDINLTVNHQKKLMKGWREAGKIIRDGEIGKIDFIRASCNGNLLEQGTHVVDMALFLNQYSKPKWVIGQIAELDGLDKDQASAPDMAIAEICVENDVRILLEIGSIGPSFNPENGKWINVGCKIYGEKGNILVTLTDGCKIQFYDDREDIFIKTSWTDDHHEGLVNHFKELINASESNQPHISNLTNSTMSFQVIMAIYQSALSMSKVDIPEGMWPDAAEKLMTFYNKK